MAALRLKKGDVVDGRFELEELVGRGAFGVVWKARDCLEGGAPVALKVLFERYRQNPKMLQRFAQEAKILERLRHPHVCHATEWSASEEVAYLAMEFVEGETLDARFSQHSRGEQPLSPRTIAIVAEQLCDAVACAHGYGIVHRDLKPNNVMVSRAGADPVVKILDFGIAKILVGSELDPTTMGRLLGSVLYVSPEQILGEAVDHRSDIFALGTILFELLTLRRAWARDGVGHPLRWHLAMGTSEANTQVAVLRRIARDPRPLVSRHRADVSKEVDDVVSKALAVDPEERYQTATEFSDALCRALVGHSLRIDKSETVVATAKHQPSFSVPDAETVLDSSALVSVSSEASLGEVRTEETGADSPGGIDEASTDAGAMIPTADTRALPVSGVDDADTAPGAEVPTPIVGVAPPPLRPAKKRRRATGADRALAVAVVLVTGAAVVLAAYLLVA